MKIISQIGIWKSYTKKTLQKLQKAGILVSRVSNISGRNSGNFQIVVANLSIFGIKGYTTVDLGHASTPNEEN